MCECLSKRLRLYSESRRTEKMGNWLRMIPMTTTQKFARRKLLTESFESKTPRSNRHPANGCLHKKGWHKEVRYREQNFRRPTCCCQTCPSRSNRTEDELKRFSSRFGSVWALVLLDEAGMTPDFMKSRLHWMEDLYWLYLWDTSILQQKHIDALKRDSDKITWLLGNNQAIVPDVVR